MRLVSPMLAVVALGFLGVRSTASPAHLDPPSDSLTAASGTTRREHPTTIDNNELWNGGMGVLVYTPRRVTISNNSIDDLGQPNTDADSNGVSVDNFQGAPVPPPGRRHQHHRQHDLQLRRGWHAGVLRAGRQSQSGLSHHLQQRHPRLPGAGYGLQRAEKREDRGQRYLLQQRLRRDRYQRFGWHRQLSAPQLLDLQQGFTPMTTMDSFPKSRTIATGWSGTTSSTTMPEIHESIGVHSVNHHQAREWSTVFWNNNRMSGSGVAGIWSQNSNFVIMNNILLLRA